MKAYVAALFLIVNSTSASAYTQLQRIENASETFAENVFQYVKSEIPEIGRVLPSTDWDDAWRSAARCILNGLAEEHGNIWVSRFVSLAEVHASQAVTSAAAVLDAPDEFRNPHIAQLAAECGLINLALSRAAQSGLMEAATTTGLGERLQALR